MFFCDDILNLPELPLLQFVISYISRIFFKRLRLPLFNLSTNCTKRQKNLQHVSLSLSFFLLSACQGGTMLGPPDTVVELGETEVSEEIFMDYLSSLGESSYRSSVFFTTFFFLPSYRKGSS